MTIGTFFIYFLTGLFFYYIGFVYQSMQIKKEGKPEWVFNLMILFKSSMSLLLYATAGLMFLNIVLGFLVGDPFPLPIWSEIFNESFPIQMGTAIPLEPIP